MHLVAVVCHQPIDCQQSRVEGFVRTKWAQEAYNSGKTAYPIDAKMCEVDEKCYTMVCNPLASA